MSKNGGYMKIILSKDDIETIVKEHYNVEAIAWESDGTLVIDTVLEKICNEKNDMHKLNELIKKKTLWSPYIWPSGNGTITSVRTPLQTQTSPEYITCTPPKIKK